MGVVPAPPALVPAPPDFGRLLSDYEQCNAAYVVGESQARGAFEDLGWEVFGWYSDDDAQAVLVWANTAHSEADLVFSGTRISEGSWEDHLGDLFRDVDCSPLGLGGGVEVAAAPFQGARKVYQWAMGLVPVGTPINFKGHSLGGWQATYAPLYVPAGRIKRIVVFDSPKQGNDRFWNYFAEFFALVFTPVVNGKDPWFAWPPIGALNHGQVKNLWTHDGTWDWVTEAEWPGGDILRLSDHGPGSGIAALEALAAAASLTSSAL
jgi:hypothetical protein